MKKFSTLLLMLPLFVSAEAQKKKEEFFVFKKDWSPAKGMDDASYFMQMVKENDTTFTCRYYNVVGPMAKWETYKDEALEIPHGRFIWYGETGMIDSTGSVWNGKKDLFWDYYFYDSARTVLTKQYNKGKLVKETSRSDIQLKPAERKVRDSLAAIEDPTQKEAKFRGGAESWRKYLERNLKMPERFQQLVPSGVTSGTVVIAFLVDPSGNVSDAYLHKSVEWSIDTEALRLIKTSPAWAPAVQKGNNVYYRQRQSITFQVDK